jgi:hypothetical protein
VGDGHRFWIERFWELYLKPNRIASFLLLSDSAILSSIENRSW